MVDTPVNFNESLKPEKIGVYMMKGADDEILYVGKAKNLKARINQYLHLQDSREFIPRMLKELREIEYVLTNTEKEALLLESQLVRRFKPRYNVRLKDDKNFLLVRIDTTQPFPRFEFVRKRKKDGASYYGPYPSARTLREFVRYLSRTYRIRVCRDSVMRQRIRPCVMHGMGWCSAPCVFPEENKDYTDRLKNALDLMTRRRSEAETRIREEMLTASDELRFEDAARYRDLLQSLKQLWARQFVRISTPIDADVFGVHQGALGGAVYVLHVRDSLVVGTRSIFNEALFAPTEPDLESLFYQFYEENEPPGTIISRLKPSDAGTLRELLQEEWNQTVQFVAPQRGSKRKLVEMAEKNARLVLEKESQHAASRQELMEAMEEAFHLPEAPVVVECVDISSFQGSDAVGSIAVAREGVISKKEYRSFHIRGSTTDDFVMMREVVQRRIKQIGDDKTPRLLVLDGGRPQLRAIAPLFEDLEAPIYLAAIAKARKERSLPFNRILLPDRDEPVDVEPHSRVMHFVMNLRDEAHRFGVAFHRKKRKKRVMQSPLLKIEGVGKQRRMELIRHFGSYDGIAAASLKDLKAVPGLPDNVAERIFAFFQEHGSGKGS